MGIYKSGDAFSFAAHKAHAEHAYVQYRRTQDRIERYEAKFGRMFKDNDREIELHLKDTEDIDVWIYHQLCKLRSVWQQVIGTETAMAKLYPMELILKDV